MEHLLKNDVIKVRTAEQLPKDTCLVTWTEENIRDFWALYLNAMNCIDNRFNYVLTHTDDYLLSEKKIEICNKLRSELYDFHSLVLEQAQHLSNRSWDADCFLNFGLTMLSCIQQFREWIAKVNALQKDIDDWAKGKVSEKNKGKKTRLHLLSINWNNAHCSAWDRLFEHMYNWLAGTLYPHLDILAKTNAPAMSHAYYVLNKLDQWRYEIRSRFQTSYWNNRAQVDFLKDLDIWWHSFTYLLEDLVHGSYDYDSRPSV